MNANVLSIFGFNKPVFSGYGPADFDIAVAPLKYIDSNKMLHTSSKKIIFRTDNGAELGVHGSRYCPVPPKTMIDAARKIILQSDLNTNDIKETIRTSHNGSRTFVKYDLPNHTYTTPDGDTATLSLLCTTSFDGTWAFMISVAAVQFACTNLQVFTSGEVAVYKSKHTQGLDIHHGSDVVIKALDVMQKENEMWKEYYTTPVTDSEAFDFFVEAANASSAMARINAEGYQDYGPETKLDLMPRTNKSLSYMWRVYRDVYKPRMGGNLWAAYNAMTDWSTHAEVSKKSEVNAASVQHLRQQKVRETVQKLFSVAA